MAYIDSNTVAKASHHQSYLTPGEKFYQNFETSHDDKRIAELNSLLQKQSGKEFRLEFYVGKDVYHLDPYTLNKIAECYKDVFNESWGENWTRKSALEEITTCLQPDPDKMPLLSLIFREDRVIGFCWAFIIDSTKLNDTNAPFSSSKLKRHESVEIARYWMNEVGNKAKFITIRELGVLREFRQDKAPFLCMPLFEKSRDNNCNVIFFRTKISSKAFKWSLGVGFVPLQFFMVDGLLLMQGSINYAVKLLKGLLEGNKRKSQQMILANINRYLCQ